LSGGTCTCVEITAGTKALRGFIALCNNF
jgi:hypothetical protein